MTKLKQVAVYLPEDLIARLLPFSAIRQANALITDAIREKLDALDGKRTIIHIDAGNSTSCLPHPDDAKPVPVIGVEGAK